MAEKDVRDALHREAEALALLERQAVALDDARVEVERCHQRLAEVEEELHNATEKAAAAGVLVAAREQDSVTLRDELDKVQLAAKVGGWPSGSRGKGAGFLGGERMGPRGGSAALQICPWHLAYPSVQGDIRRLNLELASTRQEAEEVRREAERVRAAAEVTVRTSQESFAEREAALANQLEDLKRQLQVWWVGWTDGVRRIHNHVRCTHIHGWAAGTPLCLLSLYWIWPLIHCRLRWCRH
jgi:hypothetical protein